MPFLSRRGFGRSTARSGASQRQRSLRRRPCRQHRSRSATAGRSPSRETIGATPATPVPAAARPPAILAGAPIPAGCDAVLPPNALAFDASGIAILQAVAPGQSLREAGDDVAAGSPIVEAGQRLTAKRIALLALAGCDSVPLRVPTFRVEAGAQNTLGTMLASFARAAGAAIVTDDSADIGIVLCAPGHAGTSLAAERLANTGRLLVHGLALRPGEAIGFGTVPHSSGGSRIEILLPGRFDEAMAAWLLMIEPWLAQASGLRHRSRAILRPLARRIVSAPGFAELVLLRRSLAPATPHETVAGTAAAAAAWEPLATGDLPWSAFSQAEAYGLLPAESEGLPAGAMLGGIALDAAVEETG